MSREDASSTCSTRLHHTRQLRRVTGGRRTARVGAAAFRGRARIVVDEVKVSPLHAGFEAGSGSNNELTPKKHHRNDVRPWSRERL